MFKLPFSFLPGSWGLKGNTRKIAELEYYYYGEELERKKAELLSINSNDLKIKNLEIDLKYHKIDQYTFERNKLLIEYEDQPKKLSELLLELDLKYYKIDSYTYEVELAKIQFEGEDLKHKLLAIDYDFHKISNHEYEKIKATLFGEPYIGVSSSFFDIKTGRFGIEYDWNDEFIRLLVLNGYSGLTDSDIVQKWFDSQNQTNLSETINSPPDVQVQK